VTCPRGQPLHSPARSGRACHGRESRGPRTRSVRARIGQKASLLDPCRESRPGSLFSCPPFSCSLRQFSSQSSAPKRSPKDLTCTHGPMHPPQTNKKRPCCLCSRGRSIHGPCQNSKARNEELAWNDRICWDRVPTRSTSLVALEFGRRRRLASAARALRASSAPAAGVVVAGLRARAPWVHTDFRSGGLGRGHRSRPRKPLRLVLAVVAASLA
jgi:hypothetical protein